MRIVVLDDHQDVARSFGPWRSLGAVDLVALTEHVGDPGELVLALAGADVVVAMRERTPLPREVLERLPDLRLLVTTGTANAAIDVAAACELGITVCGTRSLGSPTAELTWALILALLRHVPAEAAGMRAGEWQRYVGSGLEGRTLGVLGLGRIGTRVARVARAFDMDVLAWSSRLAPDAAAAAGATAVAFDDLLSAADVVTVHLRLSERTRGLIGARELALMQPTAYLVNTSRGPIVDEAALLDALHGERLAGAALDVFDEEPLPPHHPLRSAPRTVLTPHVGYVTEQNYRLFFGDAVEDVAAYAAGEPVRVLRG